MEKNKKIITTGLILLIVVGLVLISLLNKKKKPPQTPLPQSIQSPIQGVLPIKMKVDSDDFKFPNSLPFLRIEHDKVSENQAKNIGENLGFFAEPQIFTDVNEGVKYYWTNSEEFLIITPKTATIKYGQSEYPQQIVDNNLNNESIIMAAEEFLIENFQLSENEIEPTQVLYLKENKKTEGFEETSKEQVQIFQVNFTYQTTEHEILTLTPDKPMVFVRVLPNGSVFNAEIIKLETTNKTSERYPIKDYQQVLNNLNRAKLISVKNDYVSLYNFSITDIENIEITSIELAYLIDSPETEILQPVFLLEGPIQIQGSSADQAQLYLPATSGP